MKSRHSRIMQCLLEEVEIGASVNSSAAVSILVSKKGSIKSGRSSKVYRNMAFIPSAQGMAHLLRMSDNFEKCEGTKKKSNWRRII